MKKAFKFIVKEVKELTSNWELGTASGALKH
jgi:hypothetical protein